MSRGGVVRIAFDLSTVIVTRGLRLGLGGRTGDKKLDPPMVRGRLHVLRSMRLVRSLFFPVVKGFSVSTVAGKLLATGWI